jgi:hypothetical protein
LVGKSEGKRTLGRSRQDGRIMLKWILENWMDGWWQIHLAQDRYQWWALLDKITRFGFHKTRRRQFYASFEGFTAVMFQFEVFRLVTPCSVVVGYQRFRDPCCLHLQVEVFWVVTPCNVVVGYQILKRRYPTTKLHGVTTQKNSTWNS